MRSEAVVMSEAAYEKWYASAGKQPAGGGNAGLATFNSVGCSACHTFTAAGATGKVGPSLDNLKAAAAKAGQPLDAFIKESIVDPDKEIAPGFHAGVMPTTFGSQIPADKLDQLVQYLAENQK
jgi:cytochrome c551/c552